MNLELQGKKALVTGSTAGIGLAIASELAKEGAEVIVNGRTQQRVDAAIKSSGAAHGIAADLGTSAGAEQLFARGLAETTKGTAVTVNTVLPGPTASEGVTEFVDRIAHPKAAAARTSSANSSKSCGPLRSSSASPPPKKSPHL
jgi:NAD(P)-dependent dehydrogenase (short-subunit alcohol dehydrogenase family)